MPSSTPELAARLLNAINDLGHLALNHPMDHARRSKGDSTLRAEYLATVDTCLGMLAMVENGPNPDVFPNLAGAKEALTQLRALLPSLDWDDATSMAAIRGYARQFAEALGFALSE
jgi:hypothetical protein